MRIAILGAGNVGTALAKRLVPKGHDIVLSYSRNAEKLASVAARFGATSATPVEAVADAEVVTLAVPWNQVPDAIAAAGNLSGKILWDCTNALLPDLSGLAIGTNTSGGEEVARLAKGARVVKGIPPFAEVLHSDNPTINGKPPGVFVAGNDTDAKSIVAGLLTALPAQVTNAGNLDASRLIEPTMMLLVRLAYAQHFGPRIALNLIREER